MMFILRVSGVAIAGGRESFAMATSVFAGAGVSCAFTAASELSTVFTGGGVASLLFVPGAEAASLALAVGTSSLGFATSGLFFTSATAGKLFCGGGNFFSVPWKGVGDGGG